MKVVCNTQYKNLKGVLDVGDVVELEFIRYEEDTVIHWKWVEDGVITGDKWNNWKKKYKKFLIWLLPKVLAQVATGLNQKTVKFIQMVV